MVIKLSNLLELLSAFVSWAVIFNVKCFFKATKNQVSMLLKLLPITQFKYNNPWPIRSDWYRFLIKTNTDEQ